MACTKVPSVSEGTALVGISMAIVPPVGNRFVFSTGAMVGSVRALVNAMGDKSAEGAGHSRGEALGCKSSDNKSAGDKVKTSFCNCHSDMAGPTESSSQGSK